LQTLSVVATAKVVVEALAPVVTTRMFVPFASNVIVVTDVTPPAIRVSVRVRAASLYTYASDAPPLSAPVVGRPEASHAVYVVVPPTVVNLVNLRCESYEYVTVDVADPHAALFVVVVPI
jgi:hypothetical protein